MLCNSYITCNSYIVEWEITTNNYINVTWCLLGRNHFLQYCESQEDNVLFDISIIYR